MNVQRPLPRRDDLLARRVDAELIVHDTRTGRISHLDRLATEVWDLLDGQRDISDLAAQVGATEAEVEDTLGHLAAADLLEDRGIDRRKLLARVGVASLVAPVVSIMAPSAAAAASPLEPEVGSWSHTCQGAHTAGFSVTLTGLPPSTPVQLVSGWNPSGGAINPSNPGINDAVSSPSGVATFTWSFVSTGKPTRSRTVTLQAYIIGSTSTPISGPNSSYTGSCP